MWFTTTSTLCPVWTMPLTTLPGPAGSATWSPQWLLAGGADTWGSLHHWPGIVAVKGDAIRPLQCPSYFWTPHGEGSACYPTELPRPLLGWSHPCYWLWGCPVQPEGHLLLICQAGLRLHPKKCHLSRQKTSLLGHVISAEGVSTDPVKVSAVRDWTVPNNFEEPWSLLGLAAYYR